MMILLAAINSTEYLEKRKKLFLLLNFSYYEAQFLSEFLENFSKVNVEMKSRVHNHTLKIVVGKLLRH